MPQSGGKKGRKDMKRVCGAHQGFLQAAKTIVIPCREMRSDVLVRQETMDRLKPSKSSTIRNTDQTLRPSGEAGFFDHGSIRLKAQSMTMDQRRMMTGRTPHVASKSDISIQGREVDKCTDRWREKPPWPPQTKNNAVLKMPHCVLVAGDMCVAAGTLEVFAGIL